MKSIPFVLVLTTAGSRVNAICRLEFWGEFFSVDGLDIAPDRVLHLYSISGILKSNPLHSVKVLTNHQGCRCRNWTRRGACVGSSHRVRNRLSAWRCTRCRSLRRLRRSTLRRSDYRLRPLHGVECGFRVNHSRWWLVGMMG